VVAEESLQMQALLRIEGKAVSRLAREDVLFFG